MMRGLLVFLIYGIILAAPQLAAAETRALLIGVSDYDDCLLYTSPSPRD